MTTATPCHGLYELMDSYDGFIIDQWGVLHNGIELYDGVLETLNHLKQHKKQVVILSNSAKRADLNVQRLKSLGIKSSLYRSVVTSGEVTWHGLKAQDDAPFKGLGQRCYFIHREGDAALVDGLDLEIVDDVEDAQFILVSNTETPNKELADYEDMLKKGVGKRIPMICANPDMIGVHGAERRMGPGALAKRYHELGGMTHLIGKPHKAIFRHCMSRFDGLIPSRILVIGDSLQHDVAGAMSVDMDAAFVISGIHANVLKMSMTEDQKRKAVEHLCQIYGGIRPNWVMDSLIWQTAEAALRERERARSRD